MASAHNDHIVVFCKNEMIAWIHESNFTGRNFVGENYL